MNSDRERELEHLAQADRHVAEGETRVSEQQLRLEAMKQGGCDTALAGELLVAFERTLFEWRGHREEIRRRLATMDAAAKLP